MEIHLNVRRPGVRDTLVADHEKESDRDYDNEDFDRVERSFFIFGIRHVASFGGWYMFMVILTKTLFSSKPSGHSPAMCARAHLAGVSFYS